MDPLLHRISSTIDQLAGLLDRLYKFSYHQRQEYYERIQSSKNRLIQLKTNLRQTNLSHSQKIFQQVYLNVNILKNQISEKSSILNSKTFVNTKSSLRSNSIGAIRDRKNVSYQGGYQQNQYLKNVDRSDQPRNSQGRDNATMNRSYIKTVNANSNIMEILVAKQDEILALSQKIVTLQKQLTILHQRDSDKQEILHKMKIELQEATLNNDKLHNIIGDLKFEIRTLSDSNNRKEQQISSLRKNDKSNLDLCQQAASQINKLRQALSDSQKQISKYEQIAQQNIDKIQNLEQHFSKQKKQLQYKLQKYQIRQKDLLRKLQGLQNELQENLVAKEALNKCDEQRRRARQDVNILQVQISQVQRNYEETRNILRRQQERNTKMMNQLEQLNSSNQKLQQVINQKQKFISRYEEMKKSLEKDLQNAQDRIFRLEKESNDYRRQNSNADQSNKTLSLTIKNLEQSKAEYQKALSNCKNKVLKLTEQLTSNELQIQKLLRSNQQLRRQIDRILYKLKDQQELQNKIVIERTLVQQKDKQIKLLLIRQRQLNQINLQCQKRVQELEILVSNSQKDYEKLKCRYLRSKIQAVSDIRQIFV